MSPSFIQRAGQTAAQRPQSFPQDPPRTFPGAMARRSMKRVPDGQSAPQNQRGQRSGTAKRMKRNASPRKKPAPKGPSACSAWDRP